MYWLAINRAGFALGIAIGHCITNTTNKISVGLESLARRSLIEKSAGLFTQQPVVMEVCD